MNDARGFAFGTARLILGAGLCAVLLGPLPVAGQESPSPPPTEDSSNPPSSSPPADGSAPSADEPVPLPSPPPAESPSPVPSAPVSPVLPLPEPVPAPTPPPGVGALVSPVLEKTPVEPPVVEAPAAWTVSLTTGYYRPRLGTLNQILRDTSLTILQDPNFLLPRNQNFPFVARNLPVDEISGGATYGVDAFYNPGGPHSFGISFSGWRGETFGHDMISLFLVSNDDPIMVPRSARYNLVLDRIFLEWRYHLLRSAAGRGVYLNIGLVGVTLAFLTMDTLVNVVDPRLSFASVSSDESFGFGYTTRFGFGGDYPLTPWLSIGGQANYVLATVTKVRVTRHFSSGFPETPIPDPLSIRPGVPLPQPFFDPLEGRPVTFATVTTDSTGVQEEAIPPIRELSLELSGIEALIKLTVRF